MEEPSGEQEPALEDAKLAIDIFKKALEYRPLIEEAIVGQRFLSLAKHDRVREMVTPRIGLSYVDEAKTIPMLFFRFVGDGLPVVEHATAAHSCAGRFKSKASS